MSFAQTHDTLWYSPKFGKLSMAARGLWVTCQSWCAGQLTDGLIPDKDVKGIGGSDAQIRALIKAGLWEVAETEDGERAYQFHDWLDHNESAVKISTRKRKERERKAAQRAKKSDPGLAQTSDESDSNLTETSTKFDQDLTQTSGKSGGSFSAHTPSDQPESESVPGGKEREEKRTETKTPKCVTARPTDETHTLKNKNETKDESEEKTTPNRPRNGMDQLAARLPAPRTSSAEVDVSATEDQDTSSWDSRELDIGKPLERMSPRDLLRYIVLSQDEINGIKLSGSGSKGVATMKRFQNQYGPERAAAIMRHLFVKERGRYEVGKNGIEHITQNHFTEPLSWFTDKVDVKAQAKDSRRKGMASEFIFATEL